LYENQSEAIELYRASAATKTRNNHYTPIENLVQSSAQNATNCGVRT